MLSKLFKYIHMNTFAHIHKYINIWNIIIFWYPPSLLDICHWLTLSYLYNLIFLVILK